MVCKKETMLKRVVVVSPHPDDETLGAGGAILRFKDLGHEIYWLNVTNMKKEYGYRASAVASRQREIGQVRRKYRFDGFFDLAMKPTGLDTYPINLLVRRISDVFKKVKPGIVILPNKNDVHSDHRVVFQAAYACTKVFRYPYIKKILMMEILSETDFSFCDKRFTSNCFVDISRYLDKKIEIMKIYKGELRRAPFPRAVRNIRALAALRGSQAGCLCAESFIIVRDIS